MADEAAQNIHKLTNKSESAKRRLGQVFKFFVFAENGSRGKGSCRSFVSFFRLGGYTIRTLRVLGASARGCYCYSY